MLKHKLSDIASVSVSSVDKKRSGEEKDVHLCNYTDVYRNWAITSQIKSSFLSATATDAEISKFSLKKGQVVITKDSETSGDIGISAYVAEEFENTLLGYHCALITPKTEICNGAYLNAFLNSSTAREYFKNNASGSGQRFSLSTRALQETPIYLPTLKIQKIVGNFFSAIDRKISLNNEINRNLPLSA
ncbi:restriction endonuclease subunit S [uncultured Parasutterella sp.]|uniref:restriction endonuclease subunit S n=1 Tax=uncultured Parasutterella sp. TaxID=1263098 RepID=UPI0025934611|nr:restriction endonuclease subunit S [uncultured Parasutterella sp.]